MTAEQARNITISVRKNLPEIMETIEVMAKAGNDFATFEKKQVNITDDLLSTLKDSGYNVEQTEKHLNITW